MSKEIWCLFCPNLFETTQDMLHHIELDHKGIDADVLQNATLARETKKQLGDYLDVKKNSSGFECSMCFEYFDDVDNLNEHGKKEHNHEILPEFIKELKEMNDKFQDSPPICQKCDRQFMGLITTRLNEKIQHICFDCYEEYFGKNALTRLTIGTPDNIIIKIRQPL